MSYSQPTLASKKYWDLVAELEAIEKKTKLFLVDTGEHHWDALTHDLYDEATNKVIGKVVDGSDEYWAACYAQAVGQASGTTEEAGLDLNELIGRVVY